MDGSGHTGAIVALALTWAGVAAVLGIRWQARQMDFLRQIGRANDLPLRDPAFVARALLATAALYQAALRRQDDPALERLRREQWWLGASYAAWVLGFPALCVAVAVALVALSVMRR